MNNHNENPVFPINLYIFKEHTCQSFLKILDSLPNEEKTFNNRKILYFQT